MAGSADILRKALASASGFFVISADPASAIYSRLRDVYKRQICASVVFPTPGGPQRINEEMRPASIIFRRIAPEMCIRDRY